MDRVTKREKMAMNPTQFIPITESYSYEKSMRGLILPGGIHVISVREISGEVFAIYRKQFKATEFSIRGTWTWQADPATIIEYPNYDR